MPSPRRATVRAVATAWRSARRMAPHDSAAFLRGRRRLDRRMPCAPRASPSGSWAGVRWGSMPADVLRDALRAMWPLGATRSQTLARLVHHPRQIEAWWKCELAAHLWEHVARIDEDAYVWMESHGRADLTIARGTRNKRGALAPVTSGASVVIPMELKTLGTFWGKANVEKAYREHGKKRLEHDMLDAARGRRIARPFAAVGLLVTHAGAQTDAVNELYVRRARELGVDHNLVCVLDEAIELPTMPEQASQAHQFLWTSQPLVTNPREPAGQKSIATERPAT